MPASTIHVEPTTAGRWIVRHDNERESLSEHDSATDAQRVACDLAHIEGASAVLLHDRYARVHRVPIEGLATPKGDRPLGASPADEVKRSCGFPPSEQRPE